MTDFLADLGLPSEPTAPLFARDQPAVDFSREAVDKRKADGQRRKAEEADAQRQRSTPRPDDGVVLVNGADLKPEPIRWLWPQWLALGKLHITAGAAGQGKTTIILAFGAIVSSGGRWPDGSRCEPGNVLIWSGCLLYTSPSPRD